MSERIEIRGETDDGDEFSACIVRRRDGDEYIDWCLPNDLIGEVETMLADGRLDTILEHQTHLDKVWYGFSSRD